jgi:lipopolysaccharide transport system permease protein
LSVDWQTLLAIPALVWIAMLVIGITSVTSIMNNFARDTIYSMNYALTIMSILTPVFFPRSALPEPWNEIMAFNPVTGPLELFRWALLRIEPLDPTALAAGAAGLLLVVFVGVRFFHRWESVSLEAN